MTQITNPPKQRCWNMQKSWIWSYQNIKVKMYNIHAFDVMPCVPLNNMSLCQWIPSLMFFFPCSLVVTELLWLAREALMKPLPKSWSPCQTPEGYICTHFTFLVLLHCCSCFCCDLCISLFMILDYFNFSTGSSVWDHPVDSEYNCNYRREAKKLDSYRETWWYVDILW